MGGLMRQEAELVPKMSFSLAYWCAGRGFIVGGNAQGALVC